MVIRLWQKRCRSLRTFRETSGFRKRADSTFRLKSSRERLAVRKVPRIIHVFLRQVPTLLSSRTLRITLNPDFLFEPRYDLGKSPWVDYTLITNRWNIFRRAVELVWSRSRILILAFARQALFFFRTSIHWPVPYVDVAYSNLWCYDSRRAFSSCPLNFW